MDTGRDIGVSPHQGWSVHSADDDCVGSDRLTQPRLLILTKNDLVLVGIKKSIGNSACLKDSTLFVLSRRIAGIYAYARIQ